jgi:hypothetical protein
VDVGGGGLNVTRIVKKNIMEKRHNLIQEIKYAA